MGLVVVRLCKIRKNDNNSVGADMSNFYCENCRVVLNSKSDYGTIKNLPYCAKCYKELKIKENDNADSN